MCVIVPAILETESAGFADRVFAITHIPGVTHIQVDFADGQFVANTTISVDDVDVLNPAFTWEAHLMVSAPDNFLDYKTAGFSWVVIHRESYPSVAAVVAAAEAIKALGMRPGLAVNLGTDLPSLTDVVPHFELLLLMGIEPGFQGRVQDVHMPMRVKEASELFPSVILEIDGGVKPQNAPGLAEAGADQLVVGSALFADGNPQDAFQHLQQLVLVT